MEIKFPVNLVNVTAGPLAKAVFNFKEITTLGLVWWLIPFLIPRRKR